MLTCYSNEISWIEDEGFRSIAKDLASHVCGMIRHLPSSRSGKYHPVDERGGGGLILHSKRVAYLCVEIGREFELPVGDMIFASLFHDLGRYPVVFGFLPDLETREGHGPASSVIVQNILSSVRINEGHGPASSVIVQNIISSVQINAEGKATDLLESAYKIMNCHMGRWSKISPQPSRLVETLFCACDYLASRTNMAVPLLKENPNDSSADIPTL